MTRFNRQWQKYYNYCLGVAEWQTDCERMLIDMMSLKEMNT